MDTANKIVTFLKLLRRWLSTTSTSFSANEHYNLSVKHITTEVNNCPYIVKKTIAIPKRVTHLSSIKCKITPQEKEQDVFLDDLTKNIILNTSKNRSQSIPLPTDPYMLYLINDLICPNPLKGRLTINSELFSKPKLSSNNFLPTNEEMLPVQKDLVPFKSNYNADGNDDIEMENEPSVEMISSSNLQTEGIFEDNFVMSCEQDSSIVNYDSLQSSFINLNDIERIPINQDDYSTSTNEKFVCETCVPKSFTKIKSLFTPKVREIMANNFKSHEISSNDIIVLNPNSPKYKTLIYFKHDSIHIIEAPFTDFDNEIKNYLRALNNVGCESKVAKRINFTKFLKVSPFKRDNYTYSPHIGLSSSNVFDYMNAFNPQKNKEICHNDLILMVQESHSLECNRSESWLEEISDKRAIASSAMIPDSKNKNEEDTKSECVDFFCFSTTSEKSYSDKVPINKDKLIEESVVPNTNIINIINSIDKSAIIIQKDLYITDQIIQKIKKDEKEKQKIIDKNKVETKRSEHIMHLDNSIEENNINYLNDFTNNDENSCYIKKLTDNENQHSKSCSTKEGFSKLSVNIEHDGSDSKVVKIPITSHLQKPEVFLNKYESVEHCERDNLNTRNKNRPLKIIISNKKNVEQMDSRNFSDNHVFDGEKQSYDLDLYESNPREVSTCNRTSDSIILEFETEKFLFPIDFDEPDNKINQHHTNKKYFGENIENNYSTNSSKGVQNNYSNEPNLNKQQTVIDDFCFINFPSDAQSKLKRTHSRVNKISSKQEQFRNDISKTNTALAMTLVFNAMKEKEIAIEGSFEGEKNNSAENNSSNEGMKQFQDSGNNQSFNKPVDYTKKTIISTIRKNNYTDIKISELETFVDSRLPIPFSTETFHQIFGSDSLLQEQNSLIDRTIYKLSLSNKSKALLTPTNIVSGGKKEFIEKNLMKIKNANKSKTKSSKNKYTLPSVEKTKIKERISSPKKNHLVKKTNTLSKNIKWEYEFDKKNAVEDVKETQSLTTKEATTLPIKNKVSEEIKENANELSKKSGAKQEENKSLIPADKKENKDFANFRIKDVENKRNEVPMKKQSIDDFNKILKSNYIDLFNMYKTEKVQNKNVSDSKKTIYDHKGLSKRDKKILKEITKVIPDKISGRKKRKRHPMKPIANRRARKGVARQPIKVTSLDHRNEKIGKFSKPNLVPNPKAPLKPRALPVKKSELPVKTKKLPEKHSEIKTKLLPPGLKEKGQMKSIEKKVSESETQKSSNVKTKFVPAVRSEKGGIAHKYKEEEGNKLVEKTETRNVNVGQDKSLNPIAAIPKKLDTTNTDKNSTKTIEVSDIHLLKLKDKDISTKTPLCHTYIATEAYISHPEKSNFIESRNTPSIVNASAGKDQDPIPSGQKVTVVEKYTKLNKESESDNKEVKEIFKQELIKKSQRKIEEKSNIDFRVKAPKIKKTPTIKTPKLLKKIKQEKNIPKKGAISKVEKVIPKNEIQDASPKLPHAVKSILKQTEDPSVSMETKKEGSKSDSKKHEADLSQKLMPPNDKVEDKNISKIKDNIENFSNNSLESNSIPREALDNKHSENLTTLKKQIDEKNQKNTIEQSVPSELEQEVTLVETEKKKEFPILLIDVDKMSKEIKPDLDLNNCQNCSVSNDKITEFPILNPKKKSFVRPSKVLSLGPTSDAILRKELHMFPSVTKILNSTIPEESREILREWRRSMINELGENGFKSFYKGHLTNGSKFHNKIQDHLLKGINLQELPLNLSIKSVENVLGKITDLSAVNSHVVHKKLAYRGVIDCVAKYQGKAVLIEWKRIESPLVKIEDSTLESASMQLSAYIGALNYDDAYKFQLQSGLIVIAYGNGQEANVIEISKDQGLKHWKEWLKRLKQFHEIIRKNN